MLNLVLHADDIANYNMTASSAEFVHSARSDAEAHGEVNVLKCERQVCVEIDSITGSCGCVCGRHVREGGNHIGGEPSQPRLQQELHRYVR